jgi:predicted AAA+ superfamily ATPase
MIDDLFQLSRQMIRVNHRDYRRYFIRNADISAACSIILGARGVGKTTTLVQALIDRFPAYTRSRECLYLPMDHAAVGARVLYDIAREFAEQGGKLLWKAIFPPFILKSPLLA